MAKETASTAVSRALEILEALAQRDGGMTNSEINRKLGIPKSSASYLLRTLEQRGYLNREPGTGKYRLGLKVLGLGRGVPLQSDLKAAAQPVLRRLGERSHLTVHLAILDHGEAVYLEKIEPPGFVKMDTWIGKRMPINATAVGKVMAAYLSEAEVGAIIKEYGLVKRTPKTITSQANFLTELEKVQAKSFAVDDEENNLGARCVAAPVFDGFGRIIAAVGMSGTINDVTKTSLPKMAEMVKQAAFEISQRLGYRATTKSKRS